MPASASKTTGGAHLSQPCARYSRILPSSGSNGRSFGGGGGGGGGGGTRAAEERFEGRASKKAREENAAGRHKLAGLQVKIVHPEGRSQTGERPKKGVPKPPYQHRQELSKVQRETEKSRKAQSEYLAELERFLLHEAPADVDVCVVEEHDDAIAELVDVWSVFTAQTEALSHKDFCRMCGSSPSKEELLVCGDCGECFHEACAVNSVHSKARKIPKERRHMWRCPACRMCEVCGSGGGNGKDVLCCDGCSRCFHTHCFRPKLKAVPEEGWKCNVCVQCESCGLTQVGERKNTWRKDCTLCIPCFRLWNTGYFCPVCKGVWREETQGHRAVQCDTCKKWVHPRCCGLTEAQYKKMELAEDPVAWSCPRCTGPWRLHMTRMYPSPKMTCALHRSHGGLGRGGH